MLRVIVRLAPAVAALGILTSVSFGVSALQAEQAVELPTVTVRYADLNLNTPAGVEVLYARLRAASRSVCRVGDAQGLNDKLAEQRCYRDVLAAAVENAHLPTLTALHATGSARERRS